MEERKLQNTLNDSIETIRKLKILKDHIVNTSEGAEFEKELEHLQMITEGKSNYLKHTRKKYKDLIKGRFKLDCIMRIERSNDVDPSTGREVDYSSKPTDFTQDTVEKLIKQGEKDALKIFEGC
jgi:hypothetical protein